MRALVALRLKKAQLGGATPAATHEYNYDAYGNRTAYGLNGQWANIGVSPTTNRLTNASYDPSGNQTAQLATAATYDGFNMATSYRFDASNLETLVYTANDERSGVLRGTAWTWSLRGTDGKLLRQYRSSSTNPGAPWVWIEDFVYRDGLLLGSERTAAQGGRRHYHLDHLGSPRLVTAANGSVISEHDFLPFGEERTAIGQHQARGYDREEPLRFTGHERDFDNAQPNDSSAYIDYMHARHYATKSGRFLSVDPVLGSPEQPQSWNRYVYVMNNPLKFTDPTGMMLWGVITVTPREDPSQPEGDTQSYTIEDFFRWHAKWSDRGYNWLNRTDEQLKWANHIQSLDQRAPFSSFDECRAGGLCHEFDDIPFVGGQGKMTGKLAAQIGKAAAKNGGRAGSMGLWRLAQTLGFAVKDGGAHLRVETAGGQLVTVIAHTLHGTGTGMQIVKDLIRAAGL